MRYIDLLDSIILRKFGKIIIQRDGENCCQKSMTSFTKQPLGFCTKLNASDQRQKKVQQYRLLLYISESNNTPSRSPFSYFCKQKSRASVLNLSFSPRDLRLQKYP